MNRKLTIASFVFLLPLFMMAHGDKFQFSFTGIVSEPSGKAVQGAVISIEHNGQVIHSTQTDDEGNFDIKMEGPFNRPDQLKVKVYKKGYRTEYIVPLNCRSAIDVELERAPTPIPLMRTSPSNTFLI